MNTPSPEPTATSGASTKRDLVGTATATVTLMFLLTMLLAGMVMSNLVEEKANKIIEILAAAIPMDKNHLREMDSFWDEAKRAEKDATKK